MSQKSHNITHEIRLVTPSEARSLLERNYALQRPVTKAHARRLGADLREGRFYLSPDPLVIMVDGSVANGQHRLLAIIETGVPLEMVVSTGWPLETYDVMDSGLRRKLHHRANNPLLKHTHMIACLRAFVYGMDRDVLRQYLSEQGIMALADTYESDLQALGELEHFSRLPGGVAAVVMRAYFCGVPLQRLARFVSVAVTGIMVDPADAAAQRLSAFLQANKGRLKNHEMYPRAAAALRAFLEGRSLSKLYVATDDPFPLPIAIYDVAGIPSVALDGVGIAQPAPAKSNPAKGSAFTPISRGRRVERVPA